VDSLDTLATQANQYKAKVAFQEFLGTQGLAVTQDFRVAALAATLVTLG